MELDPETDVCNHAGQRDDRGDCPSCATLRLHITQLVADGALPSIPEGEVVSWAQAILSHEIGVECSACRHPVDGEVVTYPAFRDLVAHTTRQLRFHRLCHQMWREAATRHHC